MKKILLLTAILVTFPLMLMGQGVTTSTLTGTVLDETGETLPGANITAVHEPSGTSYGTTTRMDGSYRIANMRVGGPYTIRISFVGYRTYVAEEVFLRLGETYNQSATLSSDDLELDELVVTALGDRVFNQERTGASTNINADRIASVPTISRSVDDLTKLTPQSSGTSFAGRDSRFNNYTVVKESSTIITLVSATISLPVVTRSVLRLLKRFR